MSPRRLHHPFARSAALALTSVLLLSGIAFDVPAARAGTTITVTETADENNSDGDCSLREAIFAANQDSAVDACAAGDGADTIIVPAGTFVVGTVYDAFWINSDLTLSGTGSGQTILDGNDLRSVLHIRPNSSASINVTIERLQVRNGFTAAEDAPHDDGGGITVRSGSTVTLRRVVVRDNDAGKGGGIFNAGILTIEDSVVAHNAASSGAGIYSTNGNFTTLTILRSTIRKNATRGGSGGGLVVLTQAHIRYSTIAGNASGARGGGIWMGTGVSGDSRKLVIWSSTISGNTARTDGGGLFVDSGRTAIVRNATISGNVARSGGGVNANGAEVRLISSTVTDNRLRRRGTLPAGGGGINSSGTGAVLLRNSIVAGNHDSLGESPNCRKTITSQNYNLIGDTTGCTIDGVVTGNQLNVDPLLGPLADNGGHTLTHALLDGSSAIDGGNPRTPGTGGRSCLAWDQRGTTRPQDGDDNGTSRCDIGAYERDAIGT